MPIAMVGTAASMCIYTNNVRPIAMVGTAACMYTQKRLGHLPWWVLLHVRAYEYYQADCHGGHCCVYIHKNIIRPITMSGTAVSTYIQNNIRPIFFGWLCFYAYINNIMRNAIVDTAASAYIQIISGQLPLQALLHLRTSK